jgi:hypothetical protein
LWVALGAFGVVGVVPVGYLIQQVSLAWNHLSGGIAQYPHIGLLGTDLKELGDKPVYLKLNDAAFCVKASDLSEKLKDLGNQYLDKKLLFRQRFIGKKPIFGHREAIETKGYLTPFHDFLFFGTKIHEFWIQGWIHARITRTLEQAIVLAAIPWGIAYAFSFIFTVHSVHLSIVASVIAIEFLLLAGLSFFVSRWNRFDVDLNEQFLTWLWKQSIQNKPDKLPSDAT